MSINHAMLGILSCAPLTGYDLKKIMQDSSFMYWSGNNNQIYKVLVELLDQGYVTNEVLHQDSSPSKKVYTITQSGVAELKRWSQEAPEVLEIKKPFLIQMAWTAGLSTAQIRALLDEYERSIRDQIAMENAKIGTKRFFPSRTEREAVIWHAIDNSIIESYALELRWVDQLRTALEPFDDEEQGETKNMAPHSTTHGEEASSGYAVIKKNGHSYIRLDAAGARIASERDALDLIALCAQNGCTSLLIPEERLTEDFFRLRTGIAGAILERFSIYRIKAAAVISEGRMKGAFRDFAAESNRANTFRTFQTPEQAEAWLLK